MDDCLSVLVRIVLFHLVCKFSVLPQYTELMNIRETAPLDLFPTFLTSSVDLCSETPNTNIYYIYSYTKNRMDSINRKDVSFNKWP